MLNISNRRSRPKLRQHNQNPLQTPKNKCLYTNYTYILWYEATFLYLETHSWFNMWPAQRSSVHVPQSWCQQVFKALILRNGSRYQQLRFHWVRSQEWSALQKHASPCFSANLSACQDRIVLFWNELLILTKAFSARRFPSDRDPPQQTTSWNEETPSWDLLALGDLRSSVATTETCPDRVNHDLSSLRV